MFAEKNAKNETSKKHAAHVLVTVSNRVSSANSHIVHLPELLRTLHEGEITGRPNGSKDSDPDGASAARKVAYHPTFVLGNVAVPNMLEGYDERDHVPDSNRSQRIARKPERMTKEGHKRDCGALEETGDDVQVATKGRVERSHILDFPVLDSGELGLPLQVVSSREKPEPCHQRVNRVRLEVAQISWEVELFVDVCGEVNQQIVAVPVDEAADIAGAWVVPW